MIGQVGLGEDPPSLLVDGLSLLVHYVIVHEELAPYIEVELFHPFLRRLYGLGQQSMLDIFALLESELFHEPAYPVGAEEAEKIILEGKVKGAAPGIPLAAASAPKLVVYAPGFVPLRADDLETSKIDDRGMLPVALLFPVGEDLRKSLPVGGEVHPLLPGLLLGQEDRVAAQDYIGPAAGHVGGDGNGPEPSRLGYDVRLHFMVLGVQDPVLDPPGLQDLPKSLGTLDGGGSYQDRLSRPVSLLHVVRHGGEFFPPGSEYHVGVVLPDHGHMGGYDHHLQPVYILELLLLGGGRSGHARHFSVHPHEVLEGYGGEGLVLPSDANLFLGLDRLVEPIGVSSPEHQPAGELVDDYYLPVLVDVVDIPLEQVMSLESLDDPVAQFRSLVVRE